MPMLPNYPYFIDTCGKPDYLCNSNSSVLVACTVGSNPTTPANIKVRANLLVKLFFLASYKIPKFIVLYLEVSLMTDYFHW